MTRTQALVLAGHGSQEHPGASAAVAAHADRIRRTGAFDEVRTAFWKQDPALHDVTRHVSSDVAYVVPVLTSAGYFATEVFPRELGRGAPGGGPDLRSTESVGTHERVTAILADRVESARVGPADGVGIAIVGHGTDRSPTSGDATRRHVARLRGYERFADVTAVFLDQEPAVETLLDRLEADELVVVPLFVADGHHTTTDIPAALDHPGIGETSRIDGRLVHYTGAVGTDAEMARVIVTRAIEAGARPGRDGGELPRPARSFLAWVDRTVDGRVWGELHVHHDEEGYELRHRADIDRCGDDLHVIPGPGELETHVRHDDYGRYRSLTGHRSLPTGWRLATPDGSSLVRAVRAVYPGSIASWTADRDGRLAPTPFRTTADRQGGQLAPLAVADAETVTRTTQSVCGSCVRTPRWGPASDDAESATDPAIPCAEACPVVLSAIADATRHEAGTPNCGNHDVLSAGGVH